MPIKSSISAFSENGWKNLDVGNGTPANNPYYLAQTLGVFGTQFAISGDGNYIAISNTSAPASNVRIYSNVSNVFTLQTTLNSASAGTVSLFFGNGVSFNESGNILAVGIPDLDGSPRSPNVAIFTRSGNTWSLQQLISPSAQGANSQFGNSIALSNDGNYLIVGAPTTRSVSNSSNRCGKVYLYGFSSNTWTEQANFVGTNIQFYQLGEDVNINGTGNTALATTSRTGGQVNPTFIYTRSNTTWSEFGNISSYNTGAPVQIDISNDANLITIGGPVITPPTVFSPANSWANIGNIIYSNVSVSTCKLSGDGNTVVVSRTNKFLPTIGTGGANGYNWIQSLDQGGGSDEIEINNNGSVIVTNTANSTLIYKNI